LNSGKAVDANPTPDNSTKGASAATPAPHANPSGSEGSPKPQENKLASSSNEPSSKAGESKANSTPQDPSGTATPAKKKGRFHLLKKIIKPI
jgi:hypothetical protein